MSKRYDRRNHEKHYQYLKNKKNLPTNRNTWLTSTACSSGKVCYTDRGLAKKASADARELNGEARAMTVVLCGECGYFHIGHPKYASGNDIAQS